MKTSNATILGLLCCIVGSHAATITFETASEFTDNIRIFSGPGIYEWSDNPGVGGAPGRINASVLGTGGVRAWWAEDGDYKTFELSENELFVSVMFLAETASNSNSARIGIGVVPNDGGDIIEIALGKSAEADWTFQYTDMGGVSSITPGLTIESGVWYRFTASFETWNPEPFIPNGFSVDATIQSFGADGLTEGSVLTSISDLILISPAIASDLYGQYAAFTFQNDGGGAVAFDNLDIYQIPEPSTIMLFLISVGLLSHFNRKCTPKQNKS